jgi:DNA processing protein
MADALVVVESAIKGGALITANIANSYNRDVFAFPGKVTDKFSEGCNYLIKTNKAALIQSAKDIEYIMLWEEKSKTSTFQHKLFEELSPEEDMIIKILQEKGEVSVDYIVLQSQLSNSKIAAILLNLEFKGMVKSLPGKMYKCL